MGVVGCLKVLRQFAPLQMGRQLGGGTVCRDRLGALKREKVSEPAQPAFSAKCLARQGEVMVMPGWERVGQTGVPLAVRSPPSLHCWLRPPSLSGLRWAWLVGGVGLWVGVAPMRMQLGHLPTRTLPRGLNGQASPGCMDDVKNHWYKDQRMPAMQD